MQLLSVEPQVWHTPKHGAEDNLPFQTSERGSQAEVRAKAKRDLPVMLSRNVETIGIGELLRVPVGGSHNQRDVIAFLDLLSAYFDVFQGDARRGLYRAVVAQQLLDSRHYQRRIVS